MRDGHSDTHCKTRSATDTHPKLSSAKEEKDTASTVYRWTGRINLFLSMPLKCFYLLITGSWTWIYMSGRLFLFVLFLLPGFLVMLHYYLTHPHRDICYYIENKSSTSDITTTCSSRHYLDIYLPTHRKKAEKCPVVIFLTGGAWMIGYKMWGALMGRVLCPHGMILVIPDYRNFPGATVEEMLADVDMAIQYIIMNIADEWGGDPDNIVLVGQSAGAHLATMVCLNKAAAELRANLQPSPGVTSQSTEDAPLLTSWWKPTDLRGFIPVSGPFDIVDLYEHFQKRGLDHRILDWIFQSNLKKYSPTIVLNQLRPLLSFTEKKQNAKSLLQNGKRQHYFPPTTIIHGANDTTVPCRISHDFYRSLQLMSTINQGIDQSNFCAEVDLIVYESMTHTDPILEKPFAGDQQLHKDIYKLCQKWCTGLDEEFDETIPSCQRVAALPQVFIDLARMCNPF